MAEGAGGRLLVLGGSWFLGRAVVTEALARGWSVLDCPPDAGPHDGPAPWVILGPWEYVGRLPWWLRRITRGRRVLAPGQPAREIQPVDVRDVATFAISDAVGVYNVTGPPVTMSAFLEQCRKVTGSDASFEWITDEEWLIAQGVAQRTELPLWRTYRRACER